MFLPILFSSFSLLAVEPQLVEQAPMIQAVQVIRNHHLETADGRIAFLNGDLTAFVQEADTLNREIQALALQASAAAEEEQKGDTVVIAEELNRKMAQMIAMLPTLQTALLIDNDFQQIDTVLAKEEPLDESEQALLERIATLCTYLDQRH